MEEKKLTAKQKCWVEEYLIDLNATQAAIRAGYSEDSANRIGSENLSKPVLQAAIQAALKERSERTQITQDWVLKRYKAIADADIGQVCEWSEGGVIIKDSDDLTWEQRYSIQEVACDESIREDEKGNMFVNRRKKIKQADKLKALDKIAEHLGMFKQDVEAPIQEIKVHLVSGKQDGD